MGKKSAAKSLDVLGEDQEQVERFREEIRFIFTSVDEDGSGLIEKEEFLYAIKKNKQVADLVRKSRVLSGLVASSDFDAAFRSIDTDNGGGVSFEEFYTFCKREADEENIRRMFTLIDVDGSRSITKEELVNAFKENEELLKLVKHSKVFGKLVEENDWDKVVEEMDSDKSDGENKIDYFEFWKWCKTIAARVEISLMKDKAKARTERINAEKKIFDDELRKRLKVHTCTNGAGQGGIFQLSICPDVFNFSILEEAPNSFAVSDDETCKARQATPTMLTKRLKGLSFVRG